MNDPQLTDGLDAGQIDELGDLTGLMAHLSAYDVPEPDTDRLLARLVKPPAVAQMPHWRSWLQLAQTQVSLLNARFWWATLLVLCMGVLLVFAYGGTMLIIYTLASPMLAVAGTAYFFRPETRTVHEFELFSGYSPLELLYMRLLMVLAYTGGISLILLMVASTQTTAIAIWQLILIWIGPMIGMTGMALYATFRWNAFIGAVMPMGLWMAMIMLGWRESLLVRHMAMESPQLAANTIWDVNIIIFCALIYLVGGLLLIWRVSTRVSHEDAAV